MKIFFRFLLVSSFHPVISSVMSTKGGISSSSHFSPGFSLFIKGMSVTELGLGGLFGRFGIDVTFLATIDIACGKLLFSSEVASLCTRNGYHLISISYICICINLNFIILLSRIKLSFNIKRKFLLFVQNG